MSVLDRFRGRSGSRASPDFIPVPDTSGNERGDYATRNVIEWLTAELPGDGTSPRDWPLDLGPLTLGPQADPRVRAFVALQFLMQRYGNLIRHHRGPQRQLVKLWVTTQDGRVQAVVEQKPPGSSNYQLWLLQNPEGGVSVLFAGEFKNLPLDYQQV